MKNTHVRMNCCHVGRATQPRVTVNIREERTLVIPAHVTTPTQTAAYLRAAADEIESGRI